MKKEKHVDKLLLEEPDDDFPFYNQQPIKINGNQWCVILGMMVMGFIIFSKMHLPFLSTEVNTILKVITLPFFSWLGLVLTVGKEWHQLFRPLRKKDIGTILLFTLLSIIVSLFLSRIANLMEPLNSNPGAIENTGTTAIQYFLKSRLLDVIQLFGEEFLAILPFLACLQWLYRYNPKKRTRAVWLALLISSLLFGILHLPTYNWNLVQCLVVIGLGRIVDTLAYVKTKNLWVTYLMHLLYDTIFFTLGFLFG